MKRIVLFLATNLAIIVVLSIVLKVFGLDRAGYAGAGYGELLVFSAVVGFTGSIISLLMSKSMAKWSTGAHVITQPANEAEAWLVSSVQRLAQKAGIGMPEVAIYEGEPNAFATGAFKNSALVAVSTGLLQSMNKEEVEAVLAHEVAHVANGDMVTLTLIQGVVNTFVIFLARVIGSIVDKAVFKSERGNGPGYFITVMVLQIVLGILASIIVAWFSRHREFRADAGSAQVSRLADADGQRAAPPGRRRAGRAAGSHQGLRHHRQGGHHGALLDPSADRAADRGAAVAQRGLKEATAASAPRRRRQVHGPVGDADGPVLRSGREARRARTGAVAWRSFREGIRKMFKIEVQDDKGRWSDVYGDDGKLLTYEKEEEARAALATRFPILVQMEQFAGGKRTRVIRILEDEDDWPKRPK